MDDLYLVTKGLKLNRQYSGAEKEMSLREEQDYKLLVQTILYFEYSDKQKKKNKKSTMFQIGDGLYGKKPL